MKRLVKRISLPLMFLVGLTLLGPQTAEALGWRRHVRRVHVAHAYYVAPPVVYAPPVRVYSPGVSVHVGPGVHVHAPGVGIHVGSRYPSYHGGLRYFGW